MPRRVSKKRTNRKRSKSPKVRKLFGGSISSASFDVVKKVPVFYTNSRYVKELNGGDFSGDTITHPDFRGKPGIVMFYADWCPHCSNASTRNMWNDLGDFCYPDVAVGAMNCNDNFHGNGDVAQDIGVRGYPSIAYINIDGTIDHEMFGGERDKDSLVKFVCNKVLKPGQLNKKPKMC